MKFIFPQNYNFKNKLLGIIDYSTAFFNLFWFIIVFAIINLIFRDLSIKIFFFISCCLPVLLFSIIGFQGENIIYVIFYLISFIFKQKLFLYKK